jgi:arsenate reductase
MSDRVYNVLFLCTGNSARSIMAEAILNRDGTGRFAAFSAGSHAKGIVNPLTLKVLQDFDYPTAGLRSKGWEEFAGANAPEMDFIFTVCDSAAAEAHPAWPGQPRTAHWGIQDPAAVAGTAIEQEAAFVATCRQLKNRIAAFASLPLSSLGALTLDTQLQDIGRMANPA